MVKARLDFRFLSFLPSSLIITSSSYSSTTPTDSSRRHRHNKFLNIGEPAWHRKITFIGYLQYLKNYPRNETAINIFTTLCYSSAGDLKDVNLVVRQDANKTKRNIIIIPALYDHHSKLASLAKHCEGKDTEMKANRVFSSIYLSRSTSTLVQVSTLIFQRLPEQNRSSFANPACGCNGATYLIPVNVRTMPSELLDPTQTITRRRAKVTLKTGEIESSQCLN